MCLYKLGGMWGLEGLRLNWVLGGVGLELGR